MIKYGEDVDMLLQFYAKSYKKENRKTRRANKFNKYKLHEDNSYMKYGKNKKKINKYI